MKRFCTVLFIFVLLTAAIVLPSAADGEVAWNSIRPRALYVQDDKKLTSDINPAFSVDWPFFSVPEADADKVTCTVNMRGFAMSPDGRYMYMGIQHGGGDFVRGMYVMETATGKITDFVSRYDGNDCDGTRPHFSYPKGIAADERGYVYVGYTLSTSYNAAYLAVYRQERDGTLTLVSELPVCSLGTPGDSFGTKVGINGVAVRELDGKTYAYVVTNYDHDALYRFDVTDPNNPVLQKDFDSTGWSDMQALGGSQLDEAYYADVAEDGTVYLAISKTDGDGVAVITPDGKRCRQFIPQNGVYSVLIYGDYLLCGARTGGQVTVIDRETGKTVGALSVLDGYGERITRLQIAEDVLFICDAGSVAGVANAIYAAPLDESGQAFLDAIVQGQNAGYSDRYTEPETAIPTEPVTGGQTPPESDSTVPPEKPDTDTESKPRPPLKETSPAPDRPSTTIMVGCRSACGTIVLLILPAAWLALRKKHE